MDPKLAISDFVLPIAICVSAGMFGASGYFIAIKILEKIGLITPTQIYKKNANSPSKYIGGEQ